MRQIHDISSASSTRTLTKYSARRAVPAVLIGLLLSAAAGAQTAKVFDTEALLPVTVSPGVTLKELIGRSAADGAKTDRTSVAFFRLDAGRASAWSHNKVGEESFFILKGHGEIWTGNRAQAVGPGSFVLIPPQVVRSIRASRGETLEFYAITAPSWRAEDDVLTAAPEGAPK